MKQTDVAVPIAPETPGPSPAASSPGLPIIASSGDAPMDVRSVRLVVAAMIDEETVPAALDGLVDTVLESVGSTGNHSVVVASAMRLLAEMTARRPGDSQWNHWLARAQANAGVTAECARAYSKTGRINPEAVWFPMPDQAQNPQSVYDTVPFVKQVPILDKTTKIGSAGSCFASEISYRLQREGFNYLVYEPNPSKANGMNMASAKWGIMFNVPCLKQLVERSFGKREMPPLVWPMDSDGKTVWRDPWREEVEYASLEEYESSWRQHLDASRRVLEEVEVFVMTLGLNEVWELRTDGTVFSRCPWRLSPALVRSRTLSVEENVQQLQEMWDLWRQFNPTVKLIVTVSPVPLLATFQGDEEHVITANCSSKATLRVAAEQFSRRNADVHYFPSFETVMYCTKERWRPDNRHVSKEAVSKVMGLFDQMFLRDESAESGPARAELLTGDDPRHPDVVTEEQLVHRTIRDGLDSTGALGTTELDQLLAQYMAGLGRWARDGDMPEALYAAQRRLYSLSDGQICDLALEARRLAHPPKFGPGRHRGVLGDLGPTEVQAWVAALEEDGIAVLPGALDPALCEEMVRYAEERPACPILGPGEFGPSETFRRTRSKATRHILLDDITLEHPELLRLTLDESLLAVVRTYLGCEPTITHSHLFWSRAVQDKPDGMAAQLFHFDLNRLNFLKVFVYLTDVDGTNGPHCYIKGSHRRKPEGMHRDGRFTDAEVMEQYSSDDIVEVTGKAGTIILADTRGFHRGKQLIRGERLVHHLEYSDALVGKPLTTVPVRLPQWAQEHRLQNPRLWQKYDAGQPLPE